MKIIVKISILAILLVLLLIACGDSEDPAIAFCDALTQLQETAPTIVTLGEAADLAQIVQLGSAMDNNWQELSSAAEEMDDSTQTAFAPYDELYKAIPAITQETALPVARASLDAKNTIATDVYSELYPDYCQ